MRGIFLISRLQKDKGFLLFEVLVSTLLLSIGLIFIIQIFGSSVKSLKKAEDCFQALNVLEEKQIISRLSYEAK